MNQFVVAIAAGAIGQIIARKLERRLDAKQLRPPQLVRRNPSRRVRVRTHYRGLGR